MKNNYVAIMAGGVGSRFWPASSEEKPKQFLDIAGHGMSLLEETYKRFYSFIDKDNIFIVTNSKYKDLVLELIPDFQQKNLIIEPSRNNTAPSIAYTTFKIHELNNNANIVVAPSDHIILKESVFIKKIITALQFTDSHDSILTLGISPDRPDTGYGYIEKGNLITGIDLFKVNSFREKPDIETAKKYLESGRYLWNAGIFVFRVKIIMEALKEYSNDIFEIFNRGVGKYNTHQELDFINSEYPKSEKISIDYAVMEKAENIYTLESDIGWSDLGTWNSLHAFVDKDINNNATINTEANLINCSNNIIKTENNKKVVIKNLEGYIIVDENNTLLIYPKDMEQEIKDIDKN